MGAPTAGSGVVVVGASVAGIATADALRREGYGGRIRVVDADTAVPHDKPPLSKQALDPGHDDTRLALKPASFFAEQQIELVLGRRVETLDADDLVLTLDDGQRLRADEVVLAPGAVARRLPAPHMRGGVHVVRSLADTLELRSSLASAQRLVVAGCGFVGAEVASWGRRRGLDVTVVELAEQPFAAVLGADAASALVGLHRRHGVDLVTGVPVVAVHGGDRATGVELGDGRVLPADVVVVGLGVVPATGWLAGSGVRVSDGIVCDGFGRTNRPHVHAAGDAAAWPDPFTGAPTRLEHWTTAQQQGATVGHNIARPDEQRTAPVVPYFWSDQYGLRLQSLGWLKDADETVLVHGDFDSEEFVLLYRRGEYLAGALGLNAARHVMPYRMRIEQRVPWADAIPTAVPG